MTSRCRKFLKNCRGLTLVEVVVGVVILGTLLVGITVASSRMMLKTHLTSLRIEAYDTADKMLAIWWSEGFQKMPRDDSGAIENKENWRWRTSSRDAYIDGMDAEIVKLEILEDGFEKPLASVEILISDEKIDETENVDETENNEEPTTRPDAG